jgi:hypothetical protein
VEESLLNGVLRVFVREHDRPRHRVSPPLMQSHQVRERLGLPRCAAMTRACSRSRGVSTDTAHARAGAPRASGLTGRAMAVTIGLRGVLLRTRSG